MLTQRCQVACEIEGTEGTAETLEAADAFLAFNPRFDPIIEPNARNPVRSSLSPHPSVFGKRSARMSFDVELVGTAAAGSAIHYSDALLCCGVAETLVAVTSATYKPASASISSATLAMYMDGKIYKMWGARGTATLKFPGAGKPGIISFEFTGADFSEADGALLAAVTYNAIIPPAFQGATLTIDGYSAIVNTLEIDFGNTVALRPDANQSSGHISAVISDRRPTFRFDPENVLVATEDFMGNWRSGTQMAFSTVLGATEGNVITVTAPKIQYQGVSMGDREGVSILEIEGLCCLNSGDDEWQIAIT